MANKTNNQGQDKKKYVSNLRLAEQAWLLSNLGVMQFQEKRGGRQYKSIRGLKLATESYISYWNEKAHKPKENKHHIEDFIGNYFVGKDQELLYELMPHEISYLVPRIEVSKVYQDKEGNTYSVPYYFDYYTDQSKVEDLSNGKIERVGEAGIQNIDIELLGGQPAEARRYVLAKMDIFMSSVDVLQQPAIHPSLRKEIQNKKMDLKERRKKIPFYLDLFARTSKGGRVPFKLRMDVGWQIPELSENMFGNAKRAKRIANAVAKTNKTLWLHLKSHDLSFNQDGTLKVSIEYISSVEHELQRATLSAGNKKPITKENLRRANNILKKYKSCVEKNELQKHVDRDKGIYTINPFSSTDDKLENEGIRQLNAIKRMEGIIKGYQLTSIVDAGDLLSAIICVLDKNIYQTSVPAFELGVVDGGDFETISKGKEINLKLLKAEDIVEGRITQPRAVLSVGECSSLRTALKNARGRLKKATKSNKTKQQAKAKKEVIKELTKQISAPGIGSNKSVITYKKEFTKANGIGKDVLESNPAVIKFFFFGDLIDALIKIVYQNAINQSKKEDIQMLNKFKIILGEVGVRTYEQRGGSFPYVARRQELAKLPVSVNLFFGWLINTVYSKGRSEILLKEFIRNAILFLIPTISGQGPYFYPDVGVEKKGYHRPEISFFTNRVKDSKEIFTDTTTHQQFTRANPKRKRITPDMMKKQNYVEPTIFAKGSDMFNYFYINVRNSAFESRVQNRFKDIKYGIYHFNIGSGKGFIKSVQFNKVDSPELEAALLEKENSAEIDQVRRIYNVSITMFGNASFFPGQMIYVDPRAIGLGSPSGDRSIAKRLGLGGYYLITKVSSNLSSGKFETKLDTRWVAFGDGKEDNTVKSKKEVDKILKQKCTKIELASKVKKRNWFIISETGTAKAKNASLDEFTRKQNILTDEFQSITGQDPTKE